MVVQVSRKMRKVKEKAITKGTWPGRAGPRVDVEEEDFQEYMKGLIVETVQFDEAAARKAERDSAPVSQMPDSVVRSKVGAVAWCGGRAPEEGMTACGGTTWYW